MDGHTTITDLPQSEMFLIFTCLVALSVSEPGFPMPTFAHSAITAWAKDCQQGQVLPTPIVRRDR